MYLVWGPCLDLSSMRYMSWSKLLRLYISVEMEYSLTSIFWLDLTPNIKFHTLCVVSLHYNWIWLNMNFPSYNLLIGQLPTMLIVLWFHSFMCSSHSFLVHIWCVDLMQILVFPYNSLMHLTSWVFSSLAIIMHPKHWNFKITCILILCELVLT